MNSVQENKNELEAAVRYCESAISRAQATIESMEFRQQAASKAWHEQTGREAALEREVKRLKGIIAEGNNIIDEGKEDRSALVKKLAVMTDKYDRAKTGMALMTDELETLRSEKESSSGSCGCQGYRDLEEDRARAEGEVELLQRELEERISEVADLKVQLGEREDKWDEAQSEIATLKDQLAELSKAYKDSTNEEITMKKAWREQRELVALRDDQIAMLERRLAKYTGDKVYPFKEGDLYYVFNQLDGTWIESVWDEESERIHDSPSLPDHPHKVYFTIDQKNMIEKFNPEN